MALGFSLCGAGFWVSMGFDGFFIGFYRVLLFFFVSFNWFHFVPLGVTGFYWVLLGFTGFNWIKMVFTGFY